MSFYVGTAIQPTRIVRCFFGYFLNLKRKHVIFVRDDRFEIYNYSPSATPSLQIIREVPVNARILDADVLKLREHERLQSIAFLSSKEKVYIYSFHENEEPTVNAVCLLESGILDLKSATTTAMIRCLDYNRLVVHLQAGCIEIVEWDERKANYEVRSYRRDHLVVNATPLPSWEHHFVLMERDGNGYACRLVFESDHYTRLEQVIQPIEIRTDFSLVLPLKDAPGMVVVSDTRFSVITMGSELNADPRVEVRPGIGRAKAFKAACELDIKNRWLVIEESGEIYVLAMEFDYSYNVEDIQLDYVGLTVNPHTVTKLEDGQFFIAAHSGEHSLIRITQSETNDFEVTVQQEFLNLTPMLDMVAIQNRVDNKILTSTGIDRHGAFRVIKNCISLPVLTAFDCEHFVPRFHSLCFLNSQKSLFVMDNCTEVAFLILDHDLKDSMIITSDYEKHGLPPIKEMHSTFFAGVIEPNFYIQMHNKYGKIMSADTAEIIEEWGSATEGTATRYGDILIAKEEVIDFCHFYAEEKKFVKHFTQSFPTSVMKVRFADPENPDCKLIFVYVREAKFVYLLDYNHEKPTVTLKKKIPFSPGKMILDACIVKMANDYTYIVMSMDDGTVEFQTYDLTTEKYGELKCIEVGQIPPTFCRTYVDGELYLLLCSDQTTVMYGCAEGIDFLNVDLTRALTIVPVRDFRDAEKESMILYHTEGSIRLANYVNEQCMTTRSIPVGETVDHFVYNEYYNYIVAITQRTDLVTTLDTGETKTENTKICDTLLTQFGKPQYASPCFETKYSYPVSCRNMKTIYGECRWSLAVFCANRLCVFDVVNMPRFEEITSVTTGLINDEQYVLISTTHVYPGREFSDYNRIMLYRLSEVGNQDGNDVLTFMADRTMRQRIFGLSIRNSRLYLHTETIAIEYTFMPETKTIEQTYMVLIGHHTYVSSGTYNKEGDELVVSDVLSSTTLLRNISPEQGPPILSITRDVRCVTAASYIENDEIFTADGLYNFFVVREKPLPPIEEPPPNDCAIYNTLEMRGGYYIGDSVNSVSVGVPFVPEYARPEGLIRLQRSFTTAGGGVGILLTLEEDVFKLLKQIEIKLDKKLNVPSTHRDYRMAGGLPYENSCFLDGSFLQNMLAYRDPNVLSEGVKVPKSLVKKFPPGTTAGYMAFMYLQQLWGFH